MLSDVHCGQVRKMLTVVESCRWSRRVDGGCSGWCLTSLLGVVSCQSSTASRWRVCDCRRVASLSPGSIHRLVVGRRLSRSVVSIATLCGTTSCAVAIVGRWGGCSKRIDVVARIGEDLFLDEKLRGLSGGSVMTGGSGCRYDFAGFTGQGRPGPPYHVPT